MKKILYVVLFWLTCAGAQETNIAPPAVIGPVQVKLDSESLSSIDWLNSGQPQVVAFRQSIQKAGGGEEPFFIRPYTYGLSLEYAGLTEWMVDGLSIRYNFRYAHLKPKSFGNGASLYVGDRLDTSGLKIQPVGVVRVDANNEYVIDPETGQPYLDNKAVEIAARTWRGIPEDGLDGGDMRFIVRGATRKFEFKGGPKNAEQEYATIGPNGLTVGSQNVMELISGLGSLANQLQSRINFLECRLETINNPNAYCPPPLEP